jgi:hypothetical protein
MLTRSSLLGQLCCAVSLHHSVLAVEEGVAQAIQYAECRCGVVRDSLKPTQQSA